MKTNERLGVIQNSLSTIGRELKTIVFGYFSKVPEVVDTGDVKCASTPPNQPVACPAPAEVLIETPAEAKPVAEKQLKPNLKVCSRCKVKKPLDAQNFNRDASKISGFRSCCRECSNKKEKHQECSGCNVLKPLTADFWQRSASSITGYRGPCKECIQAARAKKSAS